jgi:Inner membrane protein YgaP-like, transmembrane domain
MKKNMGNLDRALRAFVAAPVLVVLGVVLGPTAVVSWVFYLLAAVMVGTAAVGFCPLYAPFGLSTCRPAQDRTQVPAGR